MADLTVLHEDFIAFCKRYKLDLKFHPNQFVPDDLFFGRFDDHYLIRGTVSRFHLKISSLTAPLPEDSLFVQIAPILMYLLGNHYTDPKVIVSGNRYFYEIYFKEPEINDPKRRSKINGPFWSASKFVATYFVKASVTCHVTASEFNSMVADIFPEMMPFILSLRCLQGSGIPSGVDAPIDFNDLSVHLDALLPTDWLSLHHTAELIERRRGLSIG